VSYQLKEYELSRRDHDNILELMHPTEVNYSRIKKYWEEIGLRMGFDAQTVRSSNRGERFFFARPVIRIFMLRNSVRFLAFVVASTEEEARQIAHRRNQDPNVDYLSTEVMSCVELDMGQSGCIFI